MKKNRIRLTESQLQQVIRESVKRVLREGEFDFVDDLHLNDNVPNKSGIFKGDGEKYYAWGKEYTPYYKYDAYGKKVHPGDREAPWTDENGHVHFHPQSREADVTNPYFADRMLNDLHGNGNFIKDDRYAAKKYARSGYSGTYNYYYGLPDYDGPNAEQDLENINKKQVKKDRDNMERALKAADKRPLHRKGSLNREL